MTPPIESFAYIGTTVAYQWQTNEGIGSRSADLWECLTCAAVTADPDVHKKWHQREDGKHILG